MMAGKLRYNLIAFLMCVFCTANARELNIDQAIADAEAQHLTIPEEHNFRIPTLSHFGYMFTKLDPIAENLLQSIEKNPKQSIFEVGGAYGNVAEKALDLGVEKYYLNDCNAQQLQIFASRLKESGKLHLSKSLHLIHGRCPEEIELKESSFDAIIVNKVLHFFTPENIDTFVTWLKKGLKPGGRVYIFTISPFYKKHAEILAEYEKKKKEGEHFPGYCPDFNAIQSSNAYEKEARPISLLFMELETLKKLFTQHGFKIEEEFELSIINEENPQWSPGKEMVGIIASKQ